MSPSAMQDCLSKRSRLDLWEVVRVVVPASEDVPDAGLLARDAGELEVPALHLLPGLPDEGLSLDFLFLPGVLADDEDRSALS